MTKPNIKRIQSLNRQKVTIESRLTESSSAKLISRGSYCNSYNPSSSSSIANISMNVIKDGNCPKLFSNTPLTFSVNSHPLPSKASMLGTSSTPMSCGTRTLSVSSIRSSISSTLQKGNNKCTSHFYKKSKDLVIDISEKQQLQKQKAGTHQLAKKQSKIISPSHHLTQNTHTSILSNEQANKIQTIKIFIRIKPTQTKNLCIIPYIIKIDQNNLRIDGNTARYDYIFGGDSLQEEVFEKVARPVVLGVLDGYHGSIFAYGQTGSGKTYTIFGGDQKGSQGLITRSIQCIFNNVKNGSKVFMSLLEIYKEELIDLLNQTKIAMKIKQTSQGEVVVQGQVKLQIQHINETLSLIHNAQKLRRVATTKLNQKSSRSHTILTIYIQSKSISSKLCLIDLAGSQKVSKSGANGENFQQMKKINYSLSCLGNVINALVTRKKTDHIPFRDSKLTRLLKDSLSGKFRTSIIVNCSPDNGSYDETISSLKFADRAKKIKISITKNSNKQKQNIDYLHKIINKLTNDLESTKKELNKYKLIYFDKIEEYGPKVPGHEKQEESNQLTTRQTIPSERVNLDEQMKKYGKQNINMNILRQVKKQKIQKSSINLSGLSSLNISKSTMNIYGQIGSPSVSSLSYRPDQNLDDFSFHFSSVNGAQLQDKFGNLHNN